MVERFLRGLIWASKRPERSRRGQLLSTALRSIRRLRKVSSKQLAAALGLSVRGYQHFEAGGGQLNVDYVFRFSSAINCDPVGILMAVQISQPEFAAYVADNKAMLALTLCLREFAEEAGEDVAKLDTATYLSAFRPVFVELARQAREAREASDGWVANTASKLGLLAGDDGETE